MTTSTSSINTFINNNIPGEIVTGRNTSFTLANHLVSATFYPGSQRLELTWNVMTVATYGGMHELEFRNEYRVTREDVSVLLKLYQDMDGNRLADCAFTAWGKPDLLRAIQSLITNNLITCSNPKW